MKKGLRVALCVIAAVLVLLVAGGGVLYWNVTAETAPTLNRAGMETLLHDAASSILSGEEVSFGEDVLNGLLDRVPAEDRRGITGVELTGENTLAIWCEKDLLGRTCDVRVDANLSFNDNGDLLCTFTGVHVGNLPVPLSMLSTAIETPSGTFTLENNTLTIPVNQMIGDAMDTDIQMIKSVRCDADHVYISLYSAQDLLGDLFG